MIDGITGRNCPYCKEFISPDEILNIKSKQRKVKRQGFGKTDFLPVTMLEFGCPFCGGIFFDKDKLKDDYCKQFAKRQAE
jgi:hypothetical protein